jgi:DNA-binding NarL/FixJ family response regulator
MTRGVKELKNAEIGDQLSISEFTLKKHIQNILDTMDANHPEE